MLIHEAGVYGQYPGMHVAPDPQGKIYRTALPLAGEAAGEGGIISAPPLPWIMPWRVFIVGGLNTIVESNLVQALNEPSAIGDDRWVKPGIASFSWLTSGSQNPAVLRSFIDLSSRMGWAYSFIDADWERISPTSMEDLTA